MIRRTLPVDNCQKSMKSPEFAQSERGLYFLSVLMTMRTFIVVGHLAKTTPDFSLEDIPGTSGRIDILCRCITSAFVLSHGIRHDVKIYLVLLGGEIPKIIYLRGEDLRHLNPDERTTAALLKKALAVPATESWTMSTSGIFVRTGTLEDLLKSSDIRASAVQASAIQESAESSEPAEGPQLKYLVESGADIRGADLSGDWTFVLGDHKGMTPEEEALLDQAGAERLSLGPVSLHADHCIVLINWMLDTGMCKTV